AAARRIASWPTRWPLRGWRRTSRPPNTASSVTSARSPPIGPELVSETCFFEKPPRRIELLLIDQNAARKNADRTFQHAHIAINHEMLAPRAVEQRFDRRDQPRIVGPAKLAHVQLRRRSSPGARKLSTRVATAAAGSAARKSATTLATARCSL